MIEPRGDPSKFLLLILLVFLALGPGCGKKGPPIVPKASVPPPVNDLKAETLGADSNTAFCPISQAQCSKNNERIAKDI